MYIGVLSECSILERLIKLAEIEKTEAIIEEREKNVSYTQKIKDIWDNYEGLIFDLADNSSETIEAIRKMTLLQRMKFQENVLNKLKRIKNAKTGSNQER